MYVADLCHALRGSGVKFLFFADDLVIYVVGEDWRFVSARLQAAIKEILKWNVT